MNNKLKIAGAAFASALFAGSALAEISLNPNLSVDGYAAGSARYDRTKYEDGSKDRNDTMDLDAIRLNANFKYDKTSAKISLYSPAGDDVVVPEAYVSYDFGNGIVGTAGRFLTWAGYESFDIPALNAITYADAFGIIPSHHDGVKVTYTFDNFTVGAAILDSLYGPPSIDGINAYRGDGDISDGNLGAELYFAYNDQTFSAAAVVGYERNSWLGNLESDVWLVNVWGQYYLDSSKTTLGAELTYFKVEGDDEIYTALLSVKQAISEKWAITGRLSAGQLDYDGAIDKETFVKASAIPSLALSENLEVRGEVSYTTFDKSDKDNEIFVGVQAVFKF